MALKLKQPGLHPIGQFDGYDSDFLLAPIRGGEIGRWVGIPYRSSDFAAYDCYDGYCGNPDAFRPVVTRILPATVRTHYRPLFLLDEGIIGYGTLFGYVVGAVDGQTVPNPSNVYATGGSGIIGPHTALGSGKITLWDKPGLYGVTLDSVDPAMDPATTNAMEGDPLYPDIFGRLTLNVLSAYDAATLNPTIVGRFAAFDTGGHLVTTPNYLTPNFGNPVARQFTELLFHFRIEN